MATYLQDETSMPRDMLVELALALNSRIANPTKPDPLLNSKNYHVAVVAPKGTGK